MENGESRERFCLSASFGEGLGSMEDGGLNLTFFSGGEGGGVNGSCLGFFLSFYRYLGR